MDDRAHKYDYLVDVNSNTAAAKVINFVGQRKRVLEIGCGPGSITKHLKNHSHCSIVGLEVDPDAIQLVTPFCEKVLSVDLNNADWSQLAESVGSFQTIVAADVLEHLYDPWSVLTQLRTLLDTGGEIVVSLPHVGHAAISGCLIHGSFEYRDWGLLDRTHIRFFDLAGVDKLFGSNGYKIIDVSFVMTPPEQTEFAEIWSELDDKTKQVLRKPRHADVYQVVVKAVPEDAHGVAVSVASAIQQLPSPVQPKSSIGSKLKKIVHRFRG